MTQANDLHEKWMKNEEYRTAHEKLGPEFTLARAVIDARVTTLTPLMNFFIHRDRW